MSDRATSLNENNEYDPYIISLSDDDGNEYTFEVLDDIDYMDSRYLALLPVHDDPTELLNDSGDLVILQCFNEDDPENEEYAEIDDDKEYDEVASIFVDRLQDLFDIDEEDE